MVTALFVLLFILVISVTVAAVIYVSNFFGVPILLVLAIIWLANVAARAEFKLK
jgi:cbb3-type cytochrome oxidase subunit 1